jgi:serine/threonine protein kinase
MVVVYRVEDPTLKRKVALKVMLPKFAANAIAKMRFLREAETQAAVEQDNIIPIYQVGEDNGMPFIAMPLLKWLTLADALKQKPVPPLVHITCIGREITEGLGAAHQATSGSRARSSA